MTDQDQNGNLETPPDGNVQQPETPPDTPSPEGDQPTPGTPAQPDPEDGKPEQKPEKTPEQIEQDKVYFQAEAQRAKEELAALQSKEQDEPAQPDVVAPQPQPQPPLSKDDLNTFLQDHPAEGFAAIAEYMAKEVKTALGQYTKDTELQAENREANRILREFCSKNGVSKDELQAAVSEVEQLGIKGRSAGVCNVVIKHIVLGRMLEHGQETVTAAAAKATKAAKVQALTEQPGGAGISSPGLSELRKEMQKEADNLAPDDPPV